MSATARNAAIITLVVVASIGLWRVGEVLRGDSSKSQGGVGTPSPTPSDSIMVTIENVPPTHDTPTPGPSDLP